MTDKIFLQGNKLNLKISRDHEEKCMHFLKQVAPAHIFEGIKNWDCLWENVTNRMNKTFPSKYMP